MSASVSPLSSTARILLRVALVLAWLAGVGGGVVSCQRLALYRSPFPAVAQSGRPPATQAAPAAASASAAASAPALASASAAASAPAPASAPVAPKSSLTEERQAVGLEALDRFRSTRLPLSIANLLLSAALVLMAARTLSRTRGARAWLLQFSAANGALAIVDFVVSRPERDFLLERVLRMPEIANDPSSPAVRRLMPGVLTLPLLVECALFFGLAYALARPAVVRELAPPDQDRSSMPPSSADDEDV
jgi:hypothetical protein